MSIYYDKQTQYFSRSFGHIPKAWESYLQFEEASCWNCGGEFLVERKHPDAYFVYEKCGCCEGIGVIQTTTTTIPFDVNWVLFPVFYNIRFIENNFNLFRDSGAL